ncbi:MAG TPA: aminotransferase class I/II-fold pyridoxal phosphate-dependent enzyme [Streptosporangiaceae bacterium]|nr:aminotransferase class I/II-fold pyridoxal phosphate-dependent enzyme [Streptosporangiaceae bacterium]
MTSHDGFETLAIHAGQEPDPVTGAVVPPIYQVSTYKQDGVGGLRGGYEYSRSGNPTRTALEQCLAALEGGARGLAFASGLAAEDCLIRTACSPGDHVLIPDDAYGGTYRLFARVFEGWGLSHGVVPVSDVAAVRERLAARKTAMVWVETPTNPLLGIADIRALAQAAHEAGALLVVDNTFASPYLQQPLTLGADVVVHSTTKYLGGHSDVVGGALVLVGTGLDGTGLDGTGLDGTGLAGTGLAERLAFTQNATGAVAGPFDAWLTLRGVKTLAARMDRHCRNAMRIAQMLSEHPAVAEVFYPGLASHPGHKTAQEQMRAFGGMVSFRLLAGEEAAVRTCGRTRLFTLGESLGGVESLIEHPGRMTHASVAGSALEVPGDLVRLSVGIEDCDDLLDDLRQALAG